MPMQTLPTSTNSLNLVASDSEPKISTNNITDDADANRPKSALYETVRNDNFEIMETIHRLANRQSYVEQRIEDLAKVSCQAQLSLCLTF